MAQRKLKAAESFIERVKKAAAPKVTGSMDPHGGGSISLEGQGLGSRTTTFSSVGMGSVASAPTANVFARNVRAHSALAASTSM
jgi:hypothetical protein